MTVHPHRSHVIQGFFIGGRLRVSTALQRKGIVQAALRGGSALQLPSTVQLGRPGGGQRLPQEIQRKMEAVFKADFSDIRVHVGPEAASIGALAFAHGSNLYFAPGQYNPGSPHGQRLLGHELAHVVQQRMGRVKNPFGSGIAVIQDPGLEAEAERMAVQVTSPPLMIQQKVVFPPPAVRPVNPVRQPLQRPMIVQRKTAILTMSKTGGTNDFEALNQLSGDDLDAEMAVLKNKDLLIRSNSGAHVIDGKEGDKTPVPANDLLDVDKLYVIAHGSTDTVGGLNETQLALKLLSEIKKQWKVKELFLIACNSSFGHDKGDSFAKRLHSKLSPLVDKLQPIRVTGVKGLARVDYRGAVRSLSEEAIENMKEARKKLPTANQIGKSLMDDYKSRQKKFTKEGIIEQVKRTIEKQEQGLLDQFATPTNKSLYSYVRDYNTLNF